MFKRLAILLVVAVVLWELKALYSSWAAYSRAQLKAMHKLPLADRPNRRGHFVGNLVRFFSHRRRQ
jgi:hypothetical protein